ncbi:kinesin-like protein [Recurvomyces mirabilis]|uniref:Kinesin-like protein n=1 Tax=Recurvomyces mirabilis TaxID=574656 RepID=A0AAE0TR19_9PEZI|nr:kinesin-like protein [Recurvomyces mirabilis]KAK5156352.1 kinesin-like protein [Recurvomyces mirabilis]
MSNSNAQSDAPSNPPPRYVPPHRNGTVSDQRYSKEQLLDFYKAQQSTDDGLKDGLPDLYVGGWHPDIANGSSSASWGRAEHTRDAQPGPDLCWDKDGSVQPLGLREMDDEERELFSTSVNSPIRPPTNNKDGQQSNGMSGRKTSISGNATNSGGYGLPSPSVARGFGRRRETSESYPFPSNSMASPSTTREDQRAPSPPPSLIRRRTDIRESGKSHDFDNEHEKSATTPFGTLKRNPTGPLSAGFGAPSSPWTAGPQSAGLSPMGSFGNFGLGGQQSEKRAAGGSGRPESRFKNLLTKDSNEDLGSPTVQRKSSMSSLSRVNENESWRSLDNPPAPLPEAEEELSGSAALAAGSDLSPLHARQGARGFGTPSRSSTLEEGGIGAFGMTSDNAMGSGQGFLQNRDAFHQTPAAQRSGLQLGGHEPMSPTDSNPYRSPEHGVDRLTENTDAESHEMHNAPLQGLGGFGQEQGHLGGLGGLGSFQNIGRAPPTQGSVGDRSQTGSVAGNRGFAGLGGLGQLGGASGSGAWPASQPGFGTPGRQTSGLSSAFGGGIFATSTAEMQSPSLAGLGGSGMFGQQGAGGFGGSRMASMFPQGMQDQMRDGSIERGAQQGFGGLGGLPSDLQNPFGGMPALGQSSDMQQPFGGLGHHPPPMGEPSQLQSDDQVTPQQQQPPGSSASNQPPAPQQRTMVMPDRMRWIYRDPQGQTQGPWTGLEMHDWYKAGFFSPELLVKKYEDIEYEPLAQLIRRIGNSREPFLVPQIGIPHGSATSTGNPTAWAGQPTGVSPPGPTSAGGVQPPFASSFPSFGTTLTADQQNALERRKQEEQYLMARQKEHLAQAQMAQRMGGPGQHGLAPGSGNGQLHHHSSAQSLHSQPSFGSVTSPSNGAFQSSPSHGPSGAVPGFFDNSFRSPQGVGLGAVGAGVDTLGHIREEEIPGIMDRLNIGERRTQGQFGAPGQPIGQQQAQTQPQHEQQVQQMLQDRARLQQEQAQHDAKQAQTTNEQPMPNERLQQFKQLQGQALDARFQTSISKSSASEQQTPTTQSSVASPIVPQEPMSLTEQVEAAVSAQQSPVPAQIGMPMPFPPAPSQSPLPAPAAQRTGRTSVADQLQTESRDLSQTPSVETPSAAMAPWAKEQAEAPKGPSLREIQEIEARKAAEAEAIAIAARRALAQKEMEDLVAAQQQHVAPQPGLPASASWGATASPATPTNTMSAAWTKAAQKAGGPAKTMAQIQKEEEARKKRLVAAAATVQASAMASVAAPAGSKSYANLAGKVSAPSPGAGGNSAWTTVGASGKPKTPAAGPAPATPVAALPRTVSSGIVPGALAAGQRKTPSRSATMNNGAGAAIANAQEEFRKWAVGELRVDLNKGISAEDFVETLSVLGTDRDMITEAVHGVSHTIDSRHFAEEFLRRKKLAEKGVVELSAPKSTASPAAGAANGASGWSEVAKKGPAGVGGGVGKEGSGKEGESNGAFRVVPAKKKGKR